MDLYGSVDDLIELGYETEILEIFAAYEDLTDLEQMLLTEYYYWNYDELYLAYYEHFIYEYTDELYVFLNDIQDEWWYDFYSLFENIDALKSLLNGIGDLPTISRGWFESKYEELGEELYNWEMFEYWEFLHSYIPELEEGLPVYEQYAFIWNELVQYDADWDEYYVNVEDAAAIIKMYNDYFALSEDAQALFDLEDIYTLYEMALYALAYEVEDKLGEVWNIENFDGIYGLFANLEDVLDALAAFEALPEDALEYMDEETIAYYEYLLSIKLALEEGLDVFEQIVEIEAFDYENLSDDDIAAISKMYDDYLALSEDAQELLDHEYLEYLASLAVGFVQNKIDQLPGTVEEFEELFNNEDTKETAIDDLLSAWSAYQSLSPELKDLVDADYAAHLEALHVRYLELMKPTVDLLMIGLILVHLSAGVYFAFKKRDALLPEVKA